MNQLHAETQVMLGSQPSAKMPVEKVQQRFSLFMQSFPYSGGNLRVPPRLPKIWASARSEIAMKMPSQQMFIRNSCHEYPPATELENLKPKLEATKGIARSFSSNAPSFTSKKSWAFWEFMKHWISHPQSDWASRNRPLAPLSRYCRECPGKRWVILSRLIKLLRRPLA